MRRTANIAITVVLFICIAAFLFFTRQRPSPDFAVSDVEGEVVTNKETGSHFMLSFTLRNNGTATATEVFGTVEFEHGGNTTIENCHITQDVVEVGEEVTDCYAIFWEFSTIPSKDFLITVFFAEGDPRKFNVTLQMSG